MTATPRDAASWLHEHSVAVAEGLCEMQFLANPELEKRYGPAGRAKCIEDGRHHIGYLEQAVATGHPTLFSEYVVWARVLLKNLNIPGADLKTNLHLLAKCISNAAPDELSVLCLAPLNDVLSRFDELPDEVASFIKPDTPCAGLAKRYLDLLLHSKRREASALIMEASDSGTSIREIYLEVFRPVQYEIGRLWQMNQVSVAQEHFCTAATQMIMSQLYPKLFTSARIGKKLVTACVSGDLHEIGARILTDFFEMEGWDTFYIGANTPEASLVQAVRDEKADLVALSVTMVAHVPLIESAIRAIRAEVPDVPILVGGYPFMQEPNLWSTVGADASAIHCEDAVTIGLRMTQR